jgi:hypothetical protein
MSMASHASRSTFPLRDTFSRSATDELNMSYSVFGGVPYHTPCLVHVFVGRVTRLKIKSPSSNDQAQSKALLLYCISQARSELRRILRAILFLSIISLFTFINNQNQHNVPSERSCLPLRPQKRSAMDQIMPSGKEARRSYT